jgi:hypothetical protein
MCENCYHEEYGAPTEITVRAVTAAALIRQLYQYCPVGGRCHIVVDDWNLEDDSIEFCRQAVARDKAAHGTSQTLMHEERLLAALAVMSIPERAVSLALADGFLRFHS